MMRKILLAAPVLAFALPFAFAQPTSARPLATAPEQADFCWGECDDDDGGSINLQLCVEVQIEVQVERDYQCEIQDGPACFANCTAEAVTPLCLAELGDRAGARALAACQAEREATCRSQCDSGGAAFCASDLRWDEHDDDDDGASGDKVIFIDLDVCIWLDGA